jgi:hypothetical protein
MPSWPSWLQVATGTMGHRAASEFIQHFPHLFLWKYRSAWTCLEFWWKQLETRLKHVETAEHQILF